MSTPTPWFAMNIRPWHQGKYELLDSQGEIKLYSFKKKEWRHATSDASINPALFVGWRGRMQQYSEEKIQNVVEAMESEHQRKYAIPLFRHWVSVNDSIKACRYFLIGKELGAKFRVYDRRAYKRLTKRLSLDEVETVEKSVSSYFGLDIQKYRARHGGIKR